MRASSTLQPIADSFKSPSQSPHAPYKRRQTYKLYFLGAFFGARRRHKFGLSETTTQKRGKSKKEKEKMTMCVRPLRTGFLRVSDWERESARERARARERERERERESARARERERERERHTQAHAAGLSRDLSVSMCVQNGRKREGGRESARASERERHQMTESNSCM